MLLCQMVRKARLSKDLTISIVAKDLGISPSHYHAIERGTKPRPKMEVLRSISDYFALPYDDVCVASYRIPRDVFDKVATSKELIQRIRNLEV